MNPEDVVSKLGPPHERTTVGNLARRMLSRAWRCTDCGDLNEMCPDPSRRRAPSVEASLSERALAAVVTLPFRFIEPSAPLLAKSIPKGPNWQHEVKFDGYRVHVHKASKDVAIFSRNGRDFTERFGTVAYLLRELPARSAILDGEVLANNAAGMPDFLALHGRLASADGLHLWAFDFLSLNTRDARAYPLEKRQVLLRTLLRRFDTPP